MRRAVWLVGALALSIPALGQQTGTATQGQQPPSIPVRALPLQPPASNGETAAPQHPVTPEQVKQILQLTGSTKLQRQMLTAMMPMLKASLPPYMPADVMEDFGNSLVGADWEAVMIRSYQAHLSTEDAAAAIAFYSTPSGQRFVSAAPLILKETQTAAAELSIQLMQETIARHKTEIDAAREKYEAGHPWSAPKN